MQVKEVIIKQTAHELGQDEKIVELVISSAYEALNKASKVHDELEISGFGVIKISPAKIRKRIQKNEKILGYLQKMEQNEEIEKKINRVATALNYYKERIKRYETT